MNTADFISISSSWVDVVTGRAAGEGLLITAPVSDPDAMTELLRGWFTGRTGQTYTPIDRLRPGAVIDQFTPYEAVEGVLAFWCGDWVRSTWEYHQTWNGTGYHDQLEVKHERVKRRLVGEVQADGSWGYHYQDTMI